MKLSQSTLKTGNIQSWTCVPLDCSHVNCQVCSSVDGRFVIKCTEGINIHTSWHSNIYRVEHICAQNPLENILWFSSVAIWNAECYFQSDRITDLQLLLAAYVGYLPFVLKNSRSPYFYLRSSFHLFSSFSSARDFLIFLVHFHSNRQYNIMYPLGK